MGDYLQVTTATETREQAVTLARGAVEGRLAAGVQIVGPVISIFRHQGDVGESEEWMIILKTMDERYNDLEAYLLSHHPWTNPEIGSMEVIAPRTNDYFQWIMSATRPVAD